MRIKKQAVLLLLLIAALAYALYAYWPLLSVYLPVLGQQAAREAMVAETKVAPAAAALTQEAQAAPPETKAAAAAPAVKQPLKEAELKLVDPFALRISVRPKAVAKAAAAQPQKKEVRKVAQPKLEGIWVDSDMRIAFISGQALTEGGGILGWTVRRITKTEVLLVKGTSKRSLKLEAIIQ